MNLARVKLTFFLGIIDSYQEAGLLESLKVQYDFSLPECSACLALACAFAKSSVIFVLISNYNFIPINPGCRMSERGVVVCGVRRLSTISETDVDHEEEPVSIVSSGDSEWVGSSASLCSRGKPSAESSTFTSFESYQPDTAGTAAMLLFKCFVCVSSCPACFNFKLHSS